MFISLIFIICTAAMRFCSSELRFGCGRSKIGSSSMILNVWYFTRTASSPSK